MKNIVLILGFLLVSQLAFTQDKEVVFNNEYIYENNDKTSIEINEIQELVYIIMSLTETGNNPAIINQTTPYYQDVIQHFKTFSTHEIVKILNNDLKTSIVNFILLPANAYGFRFDQNRIVSTNVYIFPAKGIGKYEINKNPIVDYIPQLEDFAEKSGFRKFYKEHEVYYDTLKIKYENFAKIDDQKKWLENKFDYKINSYRVLTSPLINSINATHTFEDNKFKETLLFLPTIKEKKEWSEKSNEANNTRIIFTEIDHNYVGPLSEKYKEKINLAFQNRSIWVDEKNKGTEHYPNPIKIFDEYLTWGLYILYAIDHYDQNTVNQMIKQIDNIMMNKRGFIKFKEYNEFLVLLYKNNKSKKIEYFYPELLDWATKQK
jgi:hypothetical protein